MKALATSYTVIWRSGTIRVTLLKWSVMTVMNLKPLLLFGRARWSRLHRTKPSHGGTERETIRLLDNVHPPLLMLRILKYRDHLLSDHLSRIVHWPYTVVQSDLLWLVRNRTVGGETGNTEASIPRVRNWRRWLSRFCLQQNNPSSDSRKRKPWLPMEARVVWRKSSTHSSSRISARGTRRLAHCGPGARPRCDHGREIVQDWNRDGPKFFRSVYPHWETTLWMYLAMIIRSCVQGKYEDSEVALPGCGEKALRHLSSGCVLRRGFVFIYLRF